jgi:hypothetical protein
MVYELFHPAGEVHTVHHAEVLERHKKWIYLPSAVLSKM